MPEPSTLVFHPVNSYPEKVHIRHGTSDTIAPIAYSERAAAVFPDAELIIFRVAVTDFGEILKQKAQIPHWNSLAILLRQGWIN